MNEIAYEEYFKGLSDVELNTAIKALVEARCDRQVMSGEKVEYLAVTEWCARHPDTIAPCIHERTVADGGFPSCYSGPTETVNLDDDETR